MPETVQILQSALFKRAYKRLHPNQKADVDDAIAEIVIDPDIPGTQYQLFLGRGDGWW